MVKPVFGGQEVMSKQGSPFYAEVDFPLA